MNSAIFNFPGLAEGINRWYEIDITAQNEGTAVSGKYIHIRFTEIQSPGSGWFNADLGLLRIGVSE